MHFIGGWRGGSRTAGLAVGIAGGAAYGLARGTGWALENTLFRPQQGSEDAAVQDVRSANNTDAFFLACPFRLEAVTKILTPEKEASSLEGGWLHLH